jgi:hypothetical protein
MAATGVRVDADQRQLLDSNRWERLAKQGRGTEFGRRGLRLLRHFGDEASPLREGGADDVTRDANVEGVVRIRESTGTGTRPASLTASQAAMSVWVGTTISAPRSMPAASSPSRGRRGRSPYRRRTRSRARRKSPSRTFTTGLFTNAPVSPSRRSMWPRPHHPRQLHRPKGEGRRRRPRARPRRALPALVPDLRAGTRRRQILDVLRSLSTSRAPSRTCAHEPRELTP